MKRRYNDIIMAIQSHPHRPAALRTQPEILELVALSRCCRDAGHRRRWLREIEELYHAVREGTPDERAALLAQADPELRREVESLLIETTRGEFLNRPAIRNAPHLPDGSTLTGLASGACLGPYRIESKLGEGGMGEVYRAIDTRLGREVAIKTIREQFNARFQREARAISSLNHPNICILHDVGPNYLVMELVEGQTIAARLKG
ncbi:MAG TPA: protein kinase, partial [Terriglobales bacterium]